MQSGLQVLPIEELREKAYTKFAIRLKTFQLLYVNAGQCVAFCSIVVTPFRTCHPSASGKLFTPTCLCHQAVDLGTGQRTVMLCGWGGNRRPGGK